MCNKKRTLIDLVAKNISEINIKERTKKKSNKKIVKNRSKKNRGFSISSILINSLVNEIKSNEEESEKKETIETIEEESEDKEETVVHGGYGTVSKHYGMVSVVKYVNYDQVWKHIGTFKSQSMYENLDGRFFSQSESKSTGILVDNRVIEKAERHFKYFISGDVIGDVGFVPPVGTNIDSKDWEKYRILTQMSIYRPLLALFRAIV